MANTKIMITLAVAFGFGGTVFACRVDVRTYTTLLTPYISLQLTGLCNTITGSAPSPSPASPIRTRFNDVIDWSTLVAAYGWFFRIINKPQRLIISWLVPLLLPKHQSKTCTRVSAPFPSSPCTLSLLYSLFLSFLFFYSTVCYVLYLW